MRRQLFRLVLFVIGLCLGSTALAVIGPTKTPLKVTSIYTNGNSSAIYVAFQSGSMPGCYGNAGGYVYASNPFFKEIHAQLLTMVATGGVQAAVIYTQNTPTNNWSDCTIDGIYLLPQ